MVVMPSVMAVMAVAMPHPMGVMAPQRDQQPRADAQHRPAGAMVDVGEDPHARVVAGGDQRQRLAGAYRVDASVDMAAMVRASTVASVCGMVPVGVAAMVGAMVVVCSVVSGHPQHAAGL